MNGHVKEVVTNEGRMIMLHKWPVEWRMNGQGGGQYNGHVTEVASLKEGE